MTDPRRTLRALAALALGAAFGLSSSAGIIQIAGARLFVTPPDEGTQAPEVIQTVACEFPQGAAGATATCTLTGVSADNSIIIQGYGGEILPGGGSNMACTDGTAYQEDAYSEAPEAGGVFIFASIHRRQNVEAGTHTVVCTHTAGSGNSYGYVWVSEVAGLLDNALDDNASNSGTSNNPTTGSITPSTASSIVFVMPALMDFGTCTFGHPPSGYTSIDVVTDGSVAGCTSADYRILTSASAQNPSYGTWDHSNQWSTVIAIYKGGTGEVTPPGDGLKRHPGWFYAPNHTIGATTSQSVIDGDLADIAEMCNEDEWVGIQLMVFWGGYEGSTAGDYSPGHNVIQQYLDALEPCGMVLTLSVWNVMFGGYPPSDITHWFPAYLIQPANGGTDSIGTYGISTNEVNGDGKIARSWQTATMDRVIARNADICAQWGDDPSFYLMLGSETSVNMVSGDGFTYAGLITQLERELTANRSACDTTQIQLVANYVATDAMMEELYALADDLDLMVGGPDTLPDAVDGAGGIQANEIFAGAIGGHDYRGELTFFSSVQTTEMCSYKGYHTPAELFGVMRNGDGSGTSAMWPTHIVVTHDETCGVGYDWAAWRDYVENTLSPTVMNGTDSTLRTNDYVKDNVCPSSTTCQ